MIEASKRLLVKAYGGKNDDTLSSLRIQKFLSGSSGTLLGLPPTEDAFILHVEKAALATIIGKSAHIPKPQQIDFTDFGWSTNTGGHLMPQRMTKNPFPEHLKRVVSCQCKKKCSGKCLCSKNNVPCYSACKCRGNGGSCSRSEYFDSENFDSEN